jgi:riboflavin kinase/FMN adenylyltransferase
MTHKTRAIALGFFDGVHLGHAALMRKTLETGSKKDLVPSVITFDAQPLALVRGNPQTLINSPQDRTALIHRDFGIDDVIFLHFDARTARMPWHTFIDFLIEDFGARHLIAGSDFRFGRNASGNAALLRLICARRRIGCDIIPKVKLDGIAISSTYIRKLLIAGDIERANKFLGHPHTLTDVVRYGYHLGSRLGTPTINMRFSESVLTPAFGVYATKARLENGDAHIGVTNIGTRPTVSGGSATITAETHILNFRENLYGRQVRLEFHARLRPEAKFPGIDELKEQISKDCDAARAFFEEDG